MSYEITFGGRFQAGLGINTGKVVVKAGSLYLPATTANVALYPIAGLVVRYQQVPSANYDVGDIAHAGVWPSSLTGLSAATAGVATYARVTSTGSLESTTSPSDGDWLMGRINTDGDLILVFANQFGSDEPNLGYTIVNLNDYGAIAGSSSAPSLAANAAAYRAAIADYATLGVDEIEVPDDVALDDTICVWDDLASGSVRNLKIVGERRKKINPGKDEIPWYGPENTGSAASLTSGLVGAADGNQGGNAWMYYVVTGISGARVASGDSKGDTIAELELSGCAQAACNGVFPIVKVNSATEVVIAVLNAALATDANNGAITWKIQRAIFDIRGRNNTVNYLAAYPGNSTSCAHTMVRISVAPGQDAFPILESDYYDFESYGANLQVIDNALEIAAVCVPTHPTHQGYALDTASPYNRPFWPSQNDTLRFYGCRNSGYGGSPLIFGRTFVKNANTTGQNRSIEFHHCGGNVLERRIDVYQKHGVGKAASMGFVDKDPSGGIISIEHVRLQQPQGQVVVDYCYAEQYARFLTIDNPTSDLSDVVIRTGGLNAGGPEAPADMDGLVFFKAGGGKVVFESVPFGILEPFTREGQLVRSTSGSHCYVTFKDCKLPTREVFARSDFEQMFSATGGYLFVTLEGCVSYDYADAGPGWQAIPNKKFTVGGASAESAGPLTYSRFGGLGFGLSNNDTATSNFLAKVTISDTATRKGWEFRDPEFDERYDGHDYEVLAIPIAKTGSPSAGSAVATVTDKCRRGAALVLEAAPGAGTSRTFALINVRDRATPVTAWHPLDEGTLQYWYRAGWDFHYEIPRRPQQADIVDGRKYFRNQCQRRAATSNTPYGDLFNAAGMPPYSALAANSGYNNRKVLTTGASHVISSNHSAGFTNPSTPLTMYFVGHPIGGSGERCAIEIYDATHGTDGLATIKHDGTNLIARCGDGQLSYATAWNSCQVVCAVFNGVSSSLYFSAATAVATGTTEPTVSITGGAGGYIYAFDSIFTGKAWSGIWAESMIFTGAHDATQRGNVMTYLGAYYGKAIGP